MNNNNDLFSIPFIGTPSNQNNNNDINNNISTNETEQKVPNLLEINNIKQEQTNNKIGINNIELQQIPVDNNIDLDKTVVMQNLLETNNQIPSDNIEDTNNIASQDLLTPNNIEPQIENSNEDELDKTVIMSKSLLENNQIPFDSGMNSNSNDTKVIPDLLKSNAVEENNNTSTENIIEQSGVPDLLTPTPTIQPIEEENIVSNNDLLSPVETNNINVIGEPLTEPNKVEEEFQNNEQEPIEPQANLIDQLSISSLTMAPTDIDNNQDTVDSTVSNMLNNLNDNEDDFIAPDDEELIKAFMGEKYYEVGRHKFFNIWGFIFGPLYLIYRKMYLMGIIFIIIQNVLGNFLNEVLIFIIIGGIIGLFFNILYGIHADNKIKKIKKRYNSNKVISMCHKKGGKSFINVILFLVLYIVVMVALTIVLGINSLVSVLVKNMDININIGNTVSTKYKDHTDYYISKLKLFMNNTDPDPGQEITVSDKNLLMITMPKAKNSEDYVTCILDNRNSTWRNGDGMFREGSTNCKEYMENAEKYITDDMYPFPDSVTISFNSNKELGPGTILTYGNSRCLYSQTKQEFECKE